MTKPITIEIDDALAERLTRIANDLGETPEQVAARAVTASIQSFESNVLFARRAKGFDREAALAWLRELADKSPVTTDDDDRLPEGYAPGR
jgi:predicted transcriptional regulator